MLFEICISKTLSGDLLSGEISLDNDRTLSAELAGGQLTEFAIYRLVRTLGSTWFGVGDSLLERSLTKRNRFAGSIIDKRRLFGSVY